jgi:penicillin-binding protein 1A
MSQSIRNAAPVNRPKAVQTPDPEGPIEPLDLLELQDLPIDIGNSEIRVDEGQGVTVNTDVNGVPLEIKLDRDGANIQPAQSVDRPMPEPR